MTIENNLDKEALYNQLSQLAEEVKQSERDVITRSEALQNNLTAVSAEAHQTISEIEQMHSELDQVDQETEAELDKLILTEAESLAETEM